AALGNTLIVILGDHGDAFGEHRTFTHGNDEYAEVTHVPMVMSLPGTIPAGRRVPELVSVRDIPATIGELTGAPGMAWPLPGHSLSRFWQAAAPGPDTVLSEIDRLPRGGPDWYPVRRGSVRSIFAWPYQLIVSADSTELYDL